MKKPRTVSLRSLQVLIHFTLLEVEVFQYSVDMLFLLFIHKVILTLCDPMDCITPGSPVLHYLPEFAQIHAHWVGDAI